MALPVGVVPLDGAAWVEEVATGAAAVRTEIELGAVGFPVGWVAAPPVWVAQPTATPDRQARRTSAVMVLMFRLAFDSLKRIGVPPTGGSNRIAPPASVPAQACFSAAFGSVRAKSCRLVQRSEV